MQRVQATQTGVIVMDRSEVVRLIAVTNTQDANGVFRATETHRDVFCDVSSVTQSEFFEGGRSGLNPEYRFTMFRYDYNDEPIVEYQGKRYGAYRTYFARNDLIEVYVERKGGTNG